MKANFDVCLEMLLEHEGGYVNHPKDPGGETNLGVTRAVYEQHVGRQYEGLNTFPTFGRGWTKRNADTLEQSRSLLL
jgi:lysozyme family protein